MAVVAIFLFGGVIMTLQMPKIYTASTTVEIGRSVPQAFKSQTAQKELWRAWGHDKKFYKTQYELIRSRALAERVATALDLAQSDFLRDPQPSLLRGCSDKIERRGSDPHAESVKARQAMAVNQVMGGLSVQPVGQSSIVRISYSALDPAWAQRISIAVAEQYEKLTLDMRYAATTTRGSSARAT